MGKIKYTLIYTIFLIIPDKSIGGMKIMLPAQNDHKLARMGITLFRAFLNPASAATMQIF
jgi:hypothetical protein